MLYDILIVILQTLGSVVAAAILVLGFAFLVFLGDADARGEPVVSRRFDRRAALVIYLSWFGLLWFFGFSKPFLMVACAAAMALCFVYAVSYRSAARRGR